MLTNLQHTDIDRNTDNDNISFRPSGTARRR